MRRNYLFIIIIIFILSMGCEEVAKILTGTISGNIIDDGNPVQGAYVLALAYNSEGSIPEGLSLESGSLTNENGRYTILEVDAGDYMVVAIKDMGSNMQFDPEDDPIGFYGEPDTLGLGITIPSRITLDDQGDDIDNIDIDDMYLLPSGK
ncbi:carboxypeptidase regulatory-like domain-containing protein [bacterium]|nr:carboxypeptidase regulatory-like domain-containing protein [bacterium]